MNIIIPKKNKCNKAKWAEEALQVAEERKEVKGKEGRERYTQRIARRDKAAFFNEQCKETGKEQKGKD